MKPPYDLTREEYRRLRKEADKHRMLPDAYIRKVLGIEDEPMKKKRGRPKKKAAKK